jgi:biopolymer transport protein ExbD
MNTLRPRRPPEPPIAVLAPLVDVVTMLLLVLLRAWSTDPPAPFAPQELDPPTALGVGSPPRLTEVALGRAGIYLDGQRVAATAWHLDHPDALLHELRTPLLQRGVDRVNLRADASLPYGLVRKTLLALREAGVEEVVVLAADRGSL